MQKYEYLKDALGEFSAEHECTEEEYREAFQSLLSSSPEYAEKIKKEIVEALQDPQWSWIDAAREVDLICTCDTEESVWEAVKELIWKALAPNEEPPEIACK